MKLFDAFLIFLVKNFYFYCIFLIDYYFLKLSMSSMNLINIEIEEIKLPQLNSFRLFAPGCLCFEKGSIGWKEEKRSKEIKQKEERRSILEEEENQKGGETVEEGMREKSGSQEAGGEQEQLGGIGRGGGGDSEGEEEGGEEISGRKEGKVGEGSEGEGREGKGGGVKGGEEVWKVNEVQTNLMESSRFPGKTIKKLKKNGETLRKETDCGPVVESKNDLRKKKKKKKKKFIKKKKKNKLK